eukprot:TRINITY_DN4116_c0_g1_i1.p1 TRINITY_DN4116_c0_g1~~TRINITY_DN4116_c0_g1_i1.p1  ORF type:complete len:584 (-),score=143.61 TRINITY_DN4116_c0_g1_i1:111-1862(-)
MHPYRDNRASYPSSQPWQLSPGSQIPQMANQIVTNVPTPHFQQHQHRSNPMQPMNPMQNPMQSHHPMQYMPEPSYHAQSHMAMHPAPHSAPMQMPPGRAPQPMQAPQQIQSPPSLHAQAPMQGDAYQAGEYKQPERPGENPGFSLFQQHRRSELQNEPEHVNVDLLKKWNTLGAEERAAYEEQSLRGGVPVSYHQESVQQQPVRQKSGNDSDGSDEEVRRMEQELADAEADTDDDRSDDSSRSSSTDSESEEENGLTKIVPQAPGGGVGELRDWEKLWTQGQGDGNTGAGGEEEGDEEGGRGKRPKRKRWKSPYDFYLQEFKTKWRDGSNTENVKEVRRIAKETWDTLAEGLKTQYKDMAQQNRELCEKGEDPLEVQPPEPEKKADTPKPAHRRARRLKSSYDFFLCEYKKTYRTERRENKDGPYDDKEARKAARQVWEGMPETEREPFEVQAREMRAREAEAEGSSDDESKLRDAYGIFRDELFEKLGSEYVDQQDADALETLVKNQWGLQPDEKKENYEKKAIDAQQAHADKKAQVLARPCAPGTGVGSTNIGGMITAFRQTGCLPPVSYTHLTLPTKRIV